MYVCMFVCLVYHPVACEACRRESFTGLRYKCQRCYNYNLCQDCFWRGRTSGNHQNEHDVKEYSFYVRNIIVSSVTVSTAMPVVCLSRPKTLLFYQAYFQDLIGTLMTAIGHKEHAL